MYLHIFIYLMKGYLFLFTKINHYFKKYFIERIIL